MKTHIRSALLAAANSNQGTSVPATGKVHREMQELGLVGPKGGLTSAGASARAKVMTEELDKAFG